MTCIHTWGWNLKESVLTDDQYWVFINGFSNFWSAKKRKDNFKKINWWCNVFYSDTTIMAFNTPKMQTFFWKKKSLKLSVGFQEKTNTWHKIWQHLGFYLRKSHKDMHFMEWFEDFKQQWNLGRWRRCNRESWKEEVWRDQRYKKDGGKSTGIIVSWGETGNSKCLKLRLKETGTGRANWREAW